MSKTHVAVIGVGSMGKNHARVYADMDNVELVCVCDAHKESAQAVAQKYRTKSYTDYKEMLSKEHIEAVSICVPTKFHKEVACYAISQNIHTLIEKPIAATVAEAQEIINTAEDNAVTVMIGHIERFNPVITELKKRLEKNELGKIYHVHCARMGPSVRRITDVGVVIDLAIHEIDILRYLLGSKITRLYAQTAQRIHSTHEDLLIGTLRFENDALGVISANWLTPKKVREITVTGEKGMFVANYLSQDLFFYENEFVRQNVVYKSHSMDILEGHMLKIKIENKEPLRNELESFIDCAAKKTAQKVTPQDGLQALRIAQTCIESARENKVISL